MPAGALAEQARSFLLFPQGLMPVQCSKGKGKSQALGAARVHSQKGLAAVVNLQGKEKVGKHQRLKINPLNLFSRKYQMA